MGTIRHGMHLGLEREANRLLRESMKDTTKHSEKSDILTPWKEQDRLRKEVYSSNGVPDEASRRGMFNRAWNSKQTHLNSRDGIAGARRQDVSHETSHYYEGDAEES